MRDPIKKPRIGRTPVSGAAVDRLRIVHLYDGDYPTPDVRTEKVSRALTDAGHEVHIVARNRGWRPTSERLGEGHVHRMRPWKLIGSRLDGALSFPAFISPRWLSFLFETVKSVRPHVIIARDLPLCPAAIWVGGWFRVPIVFDMAENYPAMIRDIWHVGRQGRFDWLVRNPTATAAVERFCLPRVDHVITVVEESAQRVIELGVPGSRVSVVSNTPLLERLPVLPEKHRLPNEPLELIYLGLMEIPRGVGELLEAVAKLRNAARSVRCTLIGDGRDLPTLREHAARLGLAADVQFLGFVPYREALPFLARADIGVVPHHATEAWNTTIPNKLFDYMGVGLPVVTSDAIPAARIVRESAAGEVFRSQNSSELAAAIARLFDDEHRRKCGEAGRRAVLERFNWARDTVQLLRAVEGATAEIESAIPSRATTTILAG